MTSHVKPTAFLLAAMLLLQGSSGMQTMTEPAPMQSRIRNSREIVTEIRQGLKDHAASITVRFDYGSDIFSELTNVVDQWVEAALTETEDPAEGDYLRYQYGGYTSHSQVRLREGRWHYRIQITPAYYAYYRQEKEASEEAERLLETFSFRWNTSEYEKARAIYTYLCNTVRYDKPHRKNQTYHLCSTAYAALVQHTATCQGYCTAAYRLLREAGLDCRIITGTAGEEALHAWLIVRIGDSYYYMDPTWDAGADTFQYFLVGAKTFADHVPAEKFRQSSFFETYRIAEESYPVT